MSPDEHSDCTDNFNMDYIPDKSGNSSDGSICTTELKITDSLVSPKENMPLEKDAVQIDQLIPLAIATGRCISVLNSNATSSGNTSFWSNAIRITPLAKGAKQSKYKKKYRRYRKKSLSKLASHLETTHSMMLLGL